MTLAAVGLAGTSVHDGPMVQRDDAGIALRTLRLRAPDGQADLAPFNVEMLSFYFLPPEVEITSPAAASLHRAAVTISAVTGEALSSDTVDPVGSISGSRYVAPEPRSRTVSRGMNRAPSQVQKRRRSRW